MVTEETIKNLEKMAKEGNKEAKECLKEKYLRLVEYYHEQYKDKIDIKDLTVIYNMIFEEFFNTNQQGPVRLFLHHQFKKILFLKFDKKEKEYYVSEIIVEACRGNLDARNKLIEHFLPIVYEEAKKHNYMNYDELVQNGSLKLIENIDTLINLHQNDTFTTNGLRRTIKIYFDSTLKSEVEVWNDVMDYKYCEFIKAVHKIESDEYQIDMSMIELMNYMENYSSVKKYKDVIKDYCFNSGSYYKTGEKYGMSHEIVRTKVKEICKGFRNI